MPISEITLRTQVRQLGERLAGHRLNRNLTQRQLADDAAVSLNTLRRLEDGENVSLDTLIRVLSALDLGDRLEVLAPPADVRPVDRVRMATGAERKRARPTEPKSAAPWTWGDEE
ncbi:helix-turn-helix transcriptional regulator [Caulobacter sp. 1776]|uniref:helix-turn-helix domain-containing protein n=1 Tax=Caulobacter sp. 1776 TaxID=3156420 RepID=UPI00339810AF